jgi:hypothetical protein
MPEPKAPSGVKSQSYNIEPTLEQIEKLNRLIESGPFEVHVARTFPLDKAADAHREVDKHFLGKLALRALRSRLMQELVSFCHQPGFRIHLNPALHEPLALLGLAVAQLEQPKIKGSDGAILQC